MSALALPRPANFDTRFGHTVEADVYMIGERIKELDPRLFVAYDPRADHPYSVIEQCTDGVDRLVFRTKSLDGRVVEKLQYLLHVPFEKRYQEALRIEAERAEEQRKNEIDELYENVGAPMLPLLERTGAIDTRGESYAKRGVTGGRGHRRSYK